MKEQSRDARSDTLTRGISFPEFTLEPAASYHSEEVGENDVCYQKRTHIVSPCEVTKK